MEPPVQSPYFNPAVGIDKRRLVEEMRGKYETVAFAGNGSPDKAAALAVVPELRFARRWLANWLTAQGEPFRTFEVWSEIADSLCG